MNNINAQKDELIGRNIFLDFADLLKWDVLFTKEKFNPIDLYLLIKSNRTGKIYKASGEIKNRNISAIKYQTHIITLHKIKYLTAENLNFALFINIIGDDIFIYDCNKILKLIKEHKITPTTKYLPNHNMKNTSYHYEKVVEVDKDSALHFLKRDNKWILIKHSK